MSFVFQKTSSIGSENPIVARLALQTSELLKATQLVPTVSSAICELYSGPLMERLSSCFLMRKAISDELEAQTASMSQEPEKWERHIPYVEKLQRHSEGFLYEAKNFLRDSLGLFNIVFGSNFEEAKDYGGQVPKGRQNVADFLDARLGHPNPLSANIRGQAAWLSEIINKRNAVEHPGKRSGTLTIFNVELAPGGDWFEPSWQRMGKRTSIIADMDRFITIMLELAEVNLVLTAKAVGDMHHFQIYEIPPANRNPSEPVRFVAQLNDELLQSLTAAVRRVT